MHFSRRFLAWLLVALAAGAALLAWTPARQWVFGPPAAAGIELSGNIEAHESVLSFTGVQAPIVRLAFDAGRVVTAGTELAAVDDRVYRHQLDIDVAAQDVARRQVEVARSTLAAARNTLTMDRLDHAQRERDRRLDAAQLQVGAMARQAYDQAATAAAQAAAVVAHDVAQVRVAEDNVGLAQANLRAAQARVALDRVTLGYTVLRAPFSGVLAVRQAELGELAGPGVAIFTLDDLDHVWLHAYLNEPDLGRVRLGQVVSVRTDSAPGHVYKGRITFISPDAEFTPKTVETHAQRVTLVYGLRIDIDNPTHALLPGMPAQASITPLGPERR